MTSSSTKGLDLAKNSALLCKNIAGLMYKNAPSLDYIAQKRNIAAAKAKILKTILFSRTPESVNALFS